MRRLGIACALLLIGGGCSCGDEAGALRVEGDHGYVRCFAEAAPDERAWTVGGARLRSEGRSLRIDGTGSPARLVVVTGPAEEAAWDALRGLEPDLAAVLGPLPRAIPDLGVPVLLVPGGGDVHPDYRAAADGEGIIDASVYRRVTVGGVELIPVAGAPAGRYAVSTDACGVGEDDVDAWELDEPEAPRVLLSWAAPTGVGGLEAAEAGSPLIARIGEAAHAEGAVFAWPREAAGRITDEPLRVGARPLSGPWVVRGDGSRAAPGPTLLLLSAEGVRPAADSP